MKIRKSIQGLLAACALAVSFGAHATIIGYGFTVSGGWFDSQGNPFGMPFSPTLNGSITVDNTQTGLAALVDFSITTGSHTWTAAEFVGPTANITFDGFGNLSDFGLLQFQSGAGTMYVFQHNTMGVNDGQGNFNACNGCVALGAGVPVPEPAALALLGIGLLGMAARRRRQG